MVGYDTNAKDDISWNQTTVCEALHLQGAIIRTQNPVQALSEVGL